MSLKQPVQYPVKYYSHLDAGAPQLADADGVIKTILKACLVTGYGTGADEKSGAGWTALFEDDFRIVLRRPLRTGNPPDIKIENGVINGTASHRIVSQDNPTGLNDATELAAVNLHARSQQTGTEWHLVVSDFGFALFYRMTEDSIYGSKKMGGMLYVGSLTPITNDIPVIVASYNTDTERSGIMNAWSEPFLNTSRKNQKLKNLLTNADYSNKVVHTLAGSETSGSFYVAQPIIIESSDSVLPFYTPLFVLSGNTTTTQITVDDRPMLRVFNQMYLSTISSGNRPYYIPLDYWEL